MRKRVIVAMSGGVDSATAAGLLVRQGFEVIGVTMRLWTKEDPDAAPAHRRCCSVEDVDDARATAQALDIPHYVLNLEKEFQQSVVDYFIEEYARGRTPNPCLACNEHVKFRALLERALALEADYLATGHYARVECSNGRFRLLRAADPEKDQSYVLYTLGQAELSRLLFPVGDYEKPEIRRLAADMRLPVCDKPDSADICFVPEGDYRAFVAERLSQAPGDVVEGDGSVVGQHEGVAAFTVGQRRGLGVALGENRFVTAIDPDRNLITIGPADDLLSDTLLAEDVSWVGGEPQLDAGPIEAKIRYRTPAAPATIRAVEGGSAEPSGRASGRGLAEVGVEVRFARPQRAVTPGQACVFYRGDEVLGGGTIARAWRTKSEERRNTSEG
jgi:tRNA-specific 2-thiouridylase